jgi:hypothetical protein
MSYYVDIIKASADVDEHDDDDDALTKRMCRNLFRDLLPHGHTCLSSMDIIHAITAAESTFQIQLHHRSALDHLLHPLLSRQSPISEDMFVEFISTNISSDLEPIRGSLFLDPPLVEPPAQRLKRKWRWHAWHIWLMSYTLLTLVMFGWKFHAYATNAPAFNLSGYSICFARGMAQVCLFNAFLVLWPVCARFKTWLAGHVHRAPTVLCYNNTGAFHRTCGYAFYISGLLHTFGQLVSILIMIPNASTDAWKKSGLARCTEFALFDEAPTVTDFLLTVPGRCEDIYIYISTSSSTCIYSRYVLVRVSVSFDVVRRR